MQTGMINTISILGCGWLGFPLAMRLLDLGYKVRGTTTTASKIDNLQAAGVDAYLVEAGAHSLTLPEQFLAADLLIITIPPGNKSGLGSYYADRMATILKQCAGFGLKNIIMISSTAVYADACRDFDETDAAEPDSAAGKNVRAAEEVVERFSGTATIIRCGGLFGPGRNPGRFFAGKTGIPNGLAPVNMVSQQDVVSVITSIIRHRAFGGVYNACSPSHPQKKEYYRQAAQQLGMQPPEFLEEATQWKRIHAREAARRLNFTFTSLDGFSD